MKNCLLLIAALLFSRVAFPQGEVIFDNRANPFGTSGVFPGVVIAPFYDVDPNRPFDSKQGNTAAGKPAGTQNYGGPPLLNDTTHYYTVTLWARNSAAFIGDDADNNLNLIGTTTMRTVTSGSNAGRVAPSSTSYYVLDVFPDSANRATFQIRVWDSLNGTVTTWAAALEAWAQDRLAVGYSKVFTVPYPLGPTFFPPQTPNLEGLESFQLWRHRPNYLLTINLKGGGTATPDPALDVYPFDTVVTLTPHADPGYSFDFWSGDVNTTNVPLIVNIRSNITVIPNFFETAVVTVDVEGNGSVSRSPNKPIYRIGEQVTLTAMPARWFRFARWGDGGLGNPRGVAVGKTNHYTAIFSATTAVETVTFGNVTRTAPVGMPIILIDGEFVVTNEISRFGHAAVAMQTTYSGGIIAFTLDGSTPDPSSYLYEGPFSISRSRILRAVAYDADFVNWWEADAIQIDITPTYSLSAFTAGGGLISVSPTNQNIPSNTVMTVTAAANAGWSFLQWLGDAQGTNPTATLLMDRDRCLEAVFGTTLRATPSGNGTIAIDPAASVYPYGFSVVLTALPGIGSAFGLWGDSGRGTNNPLLFMVTNANPNVSGLFGASPAGQYSLAVRSLGNGHVDIAPRSNRFSNGQMVTLTAIPDSGQQFLGWTGQASGLQNPLSLTFNQDTIITAIFTRRPGLTIWNCGDRKPGDPLRVILSGELTNRFGIETSSELLNWRQVRNVTNDFGRVQVDFPPTNTESQFIRAHITEQ